MFVGTYYNKIDKKGRLSVPAPFRRHLRQSMPDDLYGFRSFRADCIEIAPSSFMHNLGQKTDIGELFNQDMHDIASTIFGSSYLMNMDAEGRVKLPESIHSFLEKTEQIAIVGVGDLFQLWNMNVWRDHQKSAFERVQEKIKAGTLQMGKHNHLSIVNKG